MPSPPAQHRRAADQRRAAAAVLTVSDTRTEATDTAGRLVRTLLTDAGHDVIAQTIVPDDPHHILEQLDRWLAPVPDPRSPVPSAIITTGGTGFSPRDNTVEAAQRLLSRPGAKTLDGFGELFRMLSYHEVGPAAMLSRAVAGLIPPTAPAAAPPGGEGEGGGGGGTLLFTLPGAPNAVRLAMAKLILPELPHLLDQIDPHP